MSAAGLIGTALSLVGTVVSTVAQNQMVAEQTAASKRAENAREQQMQLEAQRQRRISVRQALLARSQSLAVGTAQGAQYGSGVAAAMGGAVAQGQENQSNVNSGEILGGRIFQANRDYFDATQRGQAGISLGQGISALGGAIVSNAGAIGRLGGNMSGNVAGQTPTVQTFGNSNAAPQPAPIPWFRTNYQMPRAFAV
jgi:hypothetical protein